MIRQGQWHFTECVYCGREARATDHVRPVSRGGTDDDSNKVPACGNCNSSKGTRLLTEWDVTRVAHGALRDPKVRAEWNRLAVAQRRRPIMPLPPARRKCPPDRGPLLLSESTTDALRVYLRTWMKKPASHPDHLRAERAVAEIMWVLLDDMDSELPDTLED